MSVRENIADNIKTVIDAISSPDVKLVSRQPFNIDELSQQQFPCVLVQTSEENREDQELGSGAKTRTGTIDFIVNGFVQGSNTNIDTLRNALITAICSKSSLGLLIDAKYTTSLFFIFSWLHINKFGHPSLNSAY